ncbi:Abi family protein [Microbacterium marinilacus]|uniref:Abi family protein n=1 Tax=Microbacterium marinilacus TaxID=415209 RepID=UPI001C8D1428|nr:Abi family protein [Microbacterium marinilacus]
MEQWVSRERLTRYRSAREDTVALYLWNAALSAQLLEMIGHVEVLLRNAVHAKLAPHSPDQKWYLDSHYNFSSVANRSIDTARNAAKRGGQVEIPGKVVAELMFGFWRFLFSARYQSTIWPRVKTAFQGVPAHARDRAKLEEVVIRVHDLRNRVAHHEPVFHQPVHQHVADLIFIAGYVDDRAARMLADQTTIFDLLSRRPPIA